MSIGSEICVFTCVSRRDRPRTLLKPSWNCPRPKRHSSAGEAKESVAVPSCNWWRSAVNTVLPRLSSTRSDCPSAPMLTFTSLFFTSSCFTYSQSGSSSNPSAMDLGTASLLVYCTLTAFFATIFTVSRPPAAMLASLRTVPAAWALRLHIPTTSTANSVENKLFRFVD